MHDLQRLCSSSTSVPVLLILGSLTLSGLKAELTHPAAFHLQIPEPLSSVPADVPRHLSCIEHAWLSQHTECEGIGSEGDKQGKARGAATIECHKAERMSTLCGKEQRVQGRGYEPKRLGLRGGSEVEEDQEAGGQGPEELGSQEGEGLGLSPQDQNLLQAVKELEEEDPTDPGLVEFLRESNDIFPRKQAKFVNLGPSGAETTRRKALERLVVPDMLDSIEAAVEAVEFAHNPGEPDLEVFVRAGEYKWEDQLLLAQRFESHVPPFSEEIHGVWFNNTDHLRLDTPMDPQLEDLISTTKQSVLHLSGETGSLLWGQWIAEAGSRGSFRRVQLLSDAQQQYAEATVEVVSASFLFESCGIRCMTGVCARLAEAAQANFKDCGIGGLGVDNPQACECGLTLHDDAIAEVESCLFTDGAEDANAIRLISNASASVKGSTVANFEHGIALFEQCSAVVSDCVFKNCTGGTVICCRQANQMCTPSLKISGCTSDSHLFEGDLMPDPLVETRNVYNESSLTFKQKADLELQEFQELEDMANSYDDLGDTHELLSKLTTEQIDSAKDDMRPGDLRKLKRLQELVLSHHGIDEDEVKQELGPEWAEWFDDPLAYSKKTEKELQAEDSSEAESEDEGAQQARELKRKSEALKRALLLQKKYMSAVPREYFDQYELKLVDRVDEAVEQIEEIQQKLRRT